MILQHIKIKDIKNLDIQELLNKPSKQGLYAREITDTLNNFSIHDSLGVYIKDGNYDSYTFKVYRRDAPIVPLENLVFSKTKDGYECLLYTYNITEEELKRIEANELIDLKEKVSKKILNTDITVENIVGKYYFNSHCFEDNYVWTTSNCSSNQHSFGEDGCWYAGGPGAATGGYVLTTTEVECDRAGSGGESSGSGSQSGGGGIRTTPVSNTRPASYMRKKKFQMENATCLNMISVENHLAIFNYLENGNTAGTITLELGNSALTYPQDRIDFVEEMLEGICNGDEILNPENLDDQITTTLPPCLNSLVNDLKSLQNGKFGQVIAQFAGNNPVSLNYNWHLSVGNLPGYAAQTSPSVQPGNIVNTVINSGLINVSTDLSLARTLIHEAFHAYLVSVYRHRNIDMSYVNLINQYSAQFGNANDLHHHTFTNSNIIDEIASALLEYGTSKGYNLTLQFCQDMAWAGLDGTNTFTNLSQNQKDRILSTLAAEQFNNSNNTLGTSPIGNTICP